MSKTIIVEQESVERDYGFAGTVAIIDHPKHGRLLLQDGFGGMDTLAGGRVRWVHGIAIQLQPGDTLAALRSRSWNECTTHYSAVVHGHDTDRPVLDWDGVAVARVAESLGL